MPFFTAEELSVTLLSNKFYGSKDKASTCVFYYMCVFRAETCCTQCYVQHNNTDEVSYGIYIYML